jgi:hypothetical protein
MSKKPTTALRRAEPHVGIFWLFRGEILFDTTPLSDAEVLGDFRIHPGNHISVWEQWRLARKVPPELEYEEYPRGRVAFDSNSKVFSLLADRCILGRRDILAKIIKQMRLPRNTSVGTDPHYRCQACLERSAE